MSDELPPASGGRTAGDSPASTSPTSASPNGAPAARFPARRHPVVRLQKDPAPPSGHDQGFRSGAGTRQAPPRAPFVQSSSPPRYLASVRLVIAVPYVFSSDPALTSDGYWYGASRRKVPQSLSMNWTSIYEISNQLKTKFS